MNEGFSIMEELRMKGDSPDREELIEIMRKQYGCFMESAVLLVGFLQDVRKRADPAYEFGTSLGIAYGVKDRYIFPAAPDYEKGLLALSHCLYQRQGVNWRISPGYLELSDP